MSPLWIKLLWSIASTNLDCLNDNAWETEGGRRKLTFEKGWHKRLSGNTRESVRQIVLTAKSKKCWQLYLQRWHGYENAASVFNREKNMVIDGWFNFTLHFLIQNVYNYPLQSAVWQFAYLLAKCQVSRLRQYSYLFWKYETDSQA